MTRSTRGLPALAMITFSPFKVFSMSFERFVFASWMLTICLFILANLAKYKRFFGVVSRFGRIVKPQMERSHIQSPFEYSGL